ncbi:flagellar protein FlgN [Paenibacillus tarimensis]|uniref:flagellar protein FlgN n=1 Tax=Paenibacillus tarimensis TaxID=416012 RepID=UPI001F1C7C98|nr:flagellar protein FlgN [Paenibacillus tarimensis]MCF2944129.1 flagellar protein FlgN [Paenibacillus tarimensis]
MSLADIMQTLEHQTELYEQLLETAKEKTPVLVHNDVDKLNGIIQKERKLIAQAEVLERARIQQTNWYFAEIKHRSRLNTLRELVQSVHHPEEKKRLIDKQQQLSSILGELQRNNALNQQLIEQSLAFINYSIDLVIDDPTEDLVYKHPMKGMPGAGRAGAFDTRA